MTNTERVTTERVTNNLNVRITDSEKDQLLDLAIEKGVKLSELVRHVLKLGMLELEKELAL